MAGYTVHERALIDEPSKIAVGAVVSGDVPALAPMAGVPARRIGWLSHAGVRLGGHRAYPEEGRKQRKPKAGALGETSENP